ncbi:MAG TPA: hypothetical protein VG297_15805 [Bryobacteraceae bacterium]|jgi:hypothetical protein|nr:hypothetical protein [Bryobacteraceae bacterium]
MRLRNLFFVAAIASSAVAQSTWKAPRTPDGHPDFQGVWSNNSATPLERPKIVEGRPYLTEQEVAALKKKAAELFDDGNSDAAFFDQTFEAVLSNVKGTKSGFKSTDGQTGDYSSVWTESRDWDNRTSLITDPADGRLPPMTQEAQERQRARLSAAGTRGSPAGPEDRSLSERCITYGTPQLVAGYQSYRQIVQSGGVVAIETEMIHDTRVIPIGGSPHVPASVQTWDGDARGHWEGDTLVVDSTNFKPGAFRNVSTEKLHVVERFTRTGPETLQWEVKIDDPGAWTKPWTAKIFLKRANKEVFEYACHEGNYGLVDILSGARREDAEEARKAAR